MLQKYDVLSPCLPIAPSLLPLDCTAPLSVTHGPDGNLWIADSEQNRIKRVTAAGVLTQYALPTVGAAVSGITSGDDGAVWFTETAANKIARITTSGAITEFAIPTTGSGPTGIMPCPNTVCAPHGGVWFTETAANRIAHYNFP